YQVGARWGRGAGRVLRVRVRLRASARAARFLLGHGRQRRQLSGQSLLGIRQARQDQGQGVPDLLVLGRRPLLAPLVAAGTLHPLTLVAGSARTVPAEGGLPEERRGSVLEIGRAHV